MATFAISWCGGWCKRKPHQHVDCQLHSHFAIVGLGSDRTLEFHTLGRVQNAILSKEPSLSR